ncbi:MAG: hypothetical protein ACYS8W_20010 [Planctomycetota bacterium]|jgi:Ni/Fe-hydrogenase subunit HybB-like protein
METLNFWIEITLMFIVPLALFVLPRVRGSVRGQFAVALIYILGFIMHRMNVAITSLDAAGKQLGAATSYYPAFLEVFTTAALVVGGFWVFWLLARYFPIFPESGDKTTADEESGATFA